MITTPGFKTARAIAIFTLFMAFQINVGCGAEPKTISKNLRAAPEVLAAWYQVPPSSLAHRRAGRNEFTAAHNRLPIGTLVRVTRISNGRNVIVRITDRGITNRNAAIDLCKEAAEKLGMIQVGMSRVRLEIIPEKALATGAEQSWVPSH